MFAESVAKKLWVGILPAVLKKTSLVTMTVVIANRAVDQDI
jgi:hypothetical protein